MFFKLKNIFIISKSQSLSENPLLAPSKTFRAKHNSSKVGIYAECNNLH